MLHDGAVLYPSALRESCKDGLPGFHEAHQYDAKPCCWQCAVQSPGFVNDVIGGRQQRAVQRDDIGALQELLFRHICQPQLLQLLILIQVMCDDRSPKTLHKQVVLIMQPIQSKSQVELCMLGTPHGHPGASALHGQGR